MTADKRVFKLASRTYPAVATEYRAWIDESGLVLEGQDIGPAVQQIWGDSDYEYWVTVEREHFDRLIEALEAKLNREPVESSDDASADDMLLGLMQDAFKTNVFTTEGDYRRWLKRSKIPSSFSSYA